jgi:ketosteroid isomerase-like protein
VSRSNAGIVIEALAAWQDRDLDRVVPLIAPQAELRPLRSQHDDTPYVGPQGARQMSDDLGRDWQSLSFEPDESHEDGENVVLIGSLRTRSRSTNAEIDTRIGWRWMVRGGLIVFGEAHSDPADALGRAGLAATTGREVALVRRHYDAYNRGDIPGMLATLHPDVEIRESDERGSGQVELYRGQVGAAEFFNEIRALVTDNEARVLSLEAHPGRIDASVRLRGTLRATGRSGSIPAVHFFTLREGLIARIETFRPNWRAEA